MNPHRAVTLAIATMLTACSSSEDVGEHRDAIRSRSSTTTGAVSTFDQAIFKATHNSYSGNYSGSRGSIVEQLDAGVRVLELDPYDDDYVTIGDYQIGHAAPGDEVWHEDGNPQTNLFADWVGAITSWADAHPDHAPIVLVVDVKEDWSTLAGAFEGNPAAFNERLSAQLGSGLLRADDVSAWPAVDSLRGQILVVLSGDTGTRSGYLADHGARPAVAANSRGQIVEVHEADTGTGDLWYWTGQLQADGRVDWRRHGRYGRGKMPAVALSDDGWVVEVHKSDTRDRLWYQTGRLQDDLDVAWLVNRDYDDGTAPTIAFDSPTTLREIHTSAAHAQNWQWSADLDPTGSIVWRDNAVTDNPPWPIASSATVSVSVADGVLQYATATVSGARIRYAQIAFVEAQPGDPADIVANARVAAGAAGDPFVGDSRRAGRVTRAWQFNSIGQRSSPAANELATDTPFADWYTQYCSSVGTVE